MIYMLMLLTSAVVYAETPNPICKDNPDGVVKDYYTNERLKTEWGCQNGQFILGSVTERVIQESHCAVLALRP